MKSYLESQITWSLQQRLGISYAVLSRDGPLALATTNHNLLQNLSRNIGNRPKELVGII